MTKIDSNDIRRGHKMLDWWKRSRNHKQTATLDCSNLRLALHTIYVFALFHCTCFSTQQSCANWFVNKIMLRRFKSKVQTANCIDRTSEKSHTRCLFCASLFHSLHIGAFWEESVGSVETHVDRLMLLCNEATKT